MKKLAKQQRNKKTFFGTCDGCGWTKELVYANEVGACFCEDCIKEVGK